MVADIVTTAPVPRFPDDIDISDFGDFVTEDDDLDNGIDTEPSERYDADDNPRVYYPICVGEVVNQRYSIEHKIGFGGFSTVWMAHDLQTKRDVALKIMTSGSGEENEHRMQSEILKNVRDTSHLVTCLESFLLRGNQRNHWVLVMPLRGQPLLSLSGRKRPIAARMSGAKQLLEALENLHKAGILHRDLNGENCMWGITSLDTLTRDAKYKILGRPLKEVISWIELWKQGELVKSLVIPENLYTNILYLGDFGLAMKVGDRVTPPGRPPLEYCSPERLHNENPSAACDMWSYMCLFAELYIGYAPFSTFSTGGVLGGMVDCLGPLPKRWKNHCTAFESIPDSWYDPVTKPSPRFTLEAKLMRNHPNIDPVEKKHVLSILTRGFSYSPEKRLTATQLLKDPSFKAIMTKYCP